MKKKKKKRKKRRRRRRRRRRRLRHLNCERNLVLWGGGGGYLFGFTVKLQVLL